MIAPWHVRAGAIVLAVASLWPLAAVFNWFGVSIATIEQMSRSDPLGFRVFPALLMFARPVLAGVTALLTPWAAIRVVTWHPSFAFGILVKTAIAQALFTVALAMTGAPVDAVLARLLPMFADRRTPGAIVSPAHFVLLQEAASDSIVSPLLAIAVACAGLAVAARFMTVTESVSETLAAPPPGAPSVATTVEISPVMSPAATAFRQDSYEVRPRSRGWIAFKRYESEYDIRALAHAKSNQENYLYSLATGALRVEPHGEVLLTVVSEAGNPRQAFGIADGTGTRIAHVEPRLTGWDIQNAARQPIAHVIRHASGPGHALYVASADGGEICRYTWSTGEGPLNPLVLVDFDSRTTFDRGLALLIAPYIEEEARLESERYFRTSGEA